MLDKVKYIKLVLPVRYGESDMPNCMPFRNNDIFDITYDISSGDILNFDKQKININDIISWNRLVDRISFSWLEEQLVFVLNDMKVTDEGSYYLLDENLNILYSIVEDYVPDSYSVDGKYGDYINLHIDFKNGKILNLKKNATYKEFLNDNNTRA